MAPRSFTTHPLVLRRVEVLRTRLITPHLMRVTLTGEQLAGFESAGRMQPGFTTPAFDDHIKLLFDAEGPVEDSLPRQLPYGIEWTVSDTRLTRDYTPRRFNHEDLELDLDVVLGHQGPASEWASSAAAGDALWFVGPKSSTILPEDLDWIMLLGDETALPAIARFLEERPTQAPAEIHLLIRDAAARVELAIRPTDTLHWHEVGHDYGDAPARILNSHQFSDGAGYVWAGAESRSLLPVRRRLRKGVGLAKHQVNVTGYWHARPETPLETTERAEHAPSGPSTEDEPTEHRPAPTLPPLKAVHRWAAVRAAVDLGLLDALAGAGMDLEQLAHQLNVPAAQLAVLLEVLELHTVIRREGRHILLGRSGSELAADDHALEEYIGFQADQVLALLSLSQGMLSDTGLHTDDAAAPGGRSAWSLQHGETLESMGRQDQEVFAELAERGEALAFVLDALLAEPLWQHVRRVGLTGPGAEAVAAVFEDRGVRAERIIDPQRAFGLGSCDVAVSALALQHRTDQECITHLQELHAVTGRAVLVESLHPDALGQHPADQRLLRLAVTGAAPRGDEEISRLAEESGWRPQGHQDLGWGFAALEFIRRWPAPSSNTP